LGRTKRFANLIAVRMLDRFDDECWHLSSIVRNATGNTPILAVESGSRQLTFGLA
jgi:hypothetical protein